MAAPEHRQSDDKSAVLERGLIALARLLAATLVGTDSDAPSETSKAPVTEVEVEASPQAQTVPASDNLPEPYPSNEALL